MKDPRIDLATAMFPQQKPVSEESRILRMLHLAYILPFVYRIFVENVESL